MVRLGRAQSAGKPKRSRRTRMGESTSATRGNGRYMSNKYILDENGAPKLESDLMNWAKWYEKSNRCVAREKIGDSEVSTVFLGLDHSFSILENTAPVLWETIVFGGQLDQEQDRCSGDRESAKAMHERMVKKVQQHQLEAREKP